MTKETNKEQEWKPWLQVMSVMLGGSAIIIFTVLFTLWMKEPTTVVIYENGDVICEIYD